MIAETHSFALFAIKFKLDTTIQHSFEMHQRSINSLINGVTKNFEQRRCP